MFCATLITASRAPDDRATVLAMVLFSDVLADPPKPPNGPRENPPLPPALTVSLTDAVLEAPS
jgi:hypothetical protein